MANPGYAAIKKWRKRHPSYSKDFMRERRQHFRKLYLKKEIAYEDIPKAYRYFVK